MIVLPWPYLLQVGWLLLSLVPLLFVQRWMHREVQVLFFLLTRRHNLALALFALVFFPGVVLHEMSHFIMAQLLMVRTGKFSLLPQVLPEGQLRLGYVETAQTDWARDALIGLAPLLSGGAVIAYLGQTRLGFLPLAGFISQGNWGIFWDSLSTLPHLPDFWVWFYLAFAISSTMLPSESDRHAWLPILLIMISLVMIALLAGAGPWMVSVLSPAFERLVQLLTAIFGVSLVLHIVLLIPLRLLRLSLSRLLGLQVIAR